METRHEYDTSNRLSKQHINLVDKTYSASYNYDSYGRVTSMTPGNGTTITYTYDELSRLSTMTTPVYKITYTYTTGTSQVSNITYEPVNSNSFVERSFSMEYDLLGNITSRDYGLFGARDYTYDSQSQMTQESTSSASYLCVYDGYGNLQSLTNRSGTHSYEYSDSVWLDLLTEYDRKKIAYEGQTYNSSTGAVTGDAISGNPISYYNGTRWTFAWNNGRELTSAQSADDSISYTYDGDGLRLTKTVDGVLYEYVYASGKLIRENIGDDVTMYFYYDLNGRPYAMQYNGLMLWPWRDNSQVSNLR